VPQTWVNDGLYEDTRVVGASPFYNYRRRALANVCRLLLEGAMHIS
jgi:hypothetical protein